jgi:hypothetical protein
LAALEDDPLSGRVRSISSSPPGLAGLEDSEPPPASVVEPPAQPRAPLAVADDDDEPFPNPKGSGKGGVVAAVVALVLIAAGAGAYFGGLIPH